MWEKSGGEMTILNQLVIKRYNSLYDFYVNEMLNI